MKRDHYLAPDMLAVTELLRQGKVSSLTVNLYLFTSVLYLGMGGGSSLYGKIQQAL